MTGKALVTGATGFVGSHLVERLLDEGLEVACLVRSTSRLTWLEALPVERRTADLENVDALTRAVAGVDYVFHVAGLLRARTAEAYAAVNIEGTRRLLRAVDRAGTRLRRFVYVGSLAAVGPNPTPEPVGETAEPHPVSGYGLSKLGGERAVLAEKARLPVTVIRPPAVYGPRDGTFLPLFVTAQRYGLAPIIGSPSKELTLVHVRDLVECLWLAATADAARGEVYFVGSGNHTWSEVIDAMEAALGRHLRRVRIPAPVARLVGEFGELKWTLTGKPQVVCRRKINDLLQTRWTCSWLKAERDLAYQPKVSLIEGMQETVAWYASHGWLKPVKPRKTGKRGEG